MSDDKLRDWAARFIFPLEGFDQPGRHPGGSSGITLPIGYDLGYVTPEQFRGDWQSTLDPAVYARLLAVIGKKGDAAVALTSKLKDIRITPAQAEHVFQMFTIPRFIQRARKAFPGFNVLPLAAQVALVSLVFNRGESFGEKGKPSWDARKEMREIREYVEEYQKAVSGFDALSKDEILSRIAQSIRSMRRLWEGKGLGGLIRRRDEEAALVASCVAVKGA